MSPVDPLSSASAAAPTFTAGAGTYRFRDTVTDSVSQTSADEVTVTILPQSVPATTTYAYDGDGDRVSQTAGGVSTSYVVNSVPKLAQSLMETTSGSTTYFVYGHDLLYSVKADGPHYHHTDSLGSTIAVTDSTAAVEQTMDYDVFGQMRTMTGTNGTRYTFTGEENDASGLVYLRARYYDPETGRFLSRDAYPADALDTQTLQRYVYVKNNPTNYVDPAGENALAPALAPSLGFLSAAGTAIAEIGSGAAAGAAAIGAVAGAAVAGVAFFAFTPEAGDSGPVPRISPATPPTGSSKGPGKNGNEIVKWVVRLGPVGHALRSGKGHEFLQRVGQTGVEIASRLQPLVQKWISMQNITLDKWGVGAARLMQFQINGITLQASIVRLAPDKFLISNFWIKG